MKMFTLSIAVLLTTLMFLFGAQAAAFALNAQMTRQSLKKLDVIRIHSRRRAHDMLHNQGYDPVVYMLQTKGKNGKPIYSFFACRGDAAFSIDVDWYGNILKEKDAGACEQQ